MATIEVAGLKTALSFLKGVDKQVRFAASQAINDTALDVQKDTVERLLPSKFTLRSKGAPWFKPGTQMGFNITFARKNKLVGEIGSRASWLTLQEGGGTKKVTGHDLTINYGARPGKTAVMPVAMKPRNLVTGKRPKRGTKITGNKLKPGQKLKKKAFIVETKKGFRAVMQRDGKTVKPLWTFKPSAKIKPVLTYHKTESELVNKVFDKHFTERLKNALATAK